MADVAVENPASTVAPHKRPGLTDSVPDIDSLEGPGNDNGDEYATLKRLQRHLEYVE
jgi:26S proteasome regulatory subunit T3